MSISIKVREMITRSSWIRRMFEEGQKLMALHGQENVFDFSLGNPNLEPPKEFLETLQKVVQTPEKGTHSYMPNAGYPQVRQKIAKSLSAEYSLPMDQDCILMTCGAAGALNVLMKTLLNPQDEVIVPLPFFPEYEFYVDNHGGKLLKAPSKEDFQLDIREIKKLLSTRTKAVFINSPNNPSGQVYHEESLRLLGELLSEFCQKNSVTIYLIADEPYRRIVYDGIEVPSVFKFYKNTIVATSYSKDLSIPGERIGFIALHPEIANRQELMNGMNFSNRILGFVNAPAIMQRVVCEIQGVCADTTLYQTNRRILCEGLKKAGFDFVMPAGAFYLFPKTPIADDVAFVRALQEELILAVPGSGFGVSGHIRLSYCVQTSMIERSLPAFEKVMKKFR